MMSVLTVHSAVGVNVGKVRLNNEDNFYFNGMYLDSENREIPATYENNCTDELQIYAVCDGMGGEANGEEASFIAASVLDKYRDMFYNVEIHDVDKYAEMYMLEAGNLIYEKSREIGNSRTGTTVAAIIVDDDRIHCYNIGDSRIYRLRDAKLSQLSEDHTPAFRAYKMGMIKYEEIKTHPHRNKLTQYLGISPAEMVVKPHIYSCNAIDKDVYLICSDGISDAVSDEKLKAVLSLPLSASEKAARLISEAMENGGHDNMTALVLNIECKTGFVKRMLSKLE